MFCYSSLHCNSNEQPEGCPSPGRRRMGMGIQILSTLKQDGSHLSQRTEDVCCHLAHRIGSAPVFPGISRRKLPWPSFWHASPGGHFRCGISDCSCFRNPPWYKKGSVLSFTLPAAADQLCSLIPSIHIITIMRELWETSVSP